MMFDESFWRLALAFGIGLLVGLEREVQRADEAAGRNIAGLRTFALVGLLGGAAGGVSASFENAVAGGLVILGGFLAIAVAATWMRVKQAEMTQDVGATTLTGVLLVFALGVMASVGDMALAAAGGVATAVTLHVKEQADAILARFSQLEVGSVLQLAVMSAIVLPLLPDEGMGPYDALNPRELWMLVILIAAFSFIGYVAVKLLGKRKGVLVAGFAGGLASSTAATLSLSRAARKAPDAAYAGGVTLANIVMFARVGLVTFILSPALAQIVAPAMAAGALGSAVVGAYHLRRREAGDAEAMQTPARNPLELFAALQFGALLAVVTLLAAMVRELIGAQGLIALGAVSGLVDVDAVTLSYARMAGSHGALNILAAGVLAAVVVNCAAKSGIAAFAGGRAHGLRCAAALGAGGVAAVLAYFGAVAVVR